MKRHLLVILALVMCVGLQAQKKDKSMTDSYARNSLTYFLLDFEDDKYEADIQRAFLETGVATKYDDNNAFFNDRIIDAPYKRIERKDSKMGDMLGKMKKAKLTEADSIDQILLAAIQQTDYSAQVIYKWWGLDSDGSFPEDMNESLMAKRGAYNATDEDYNIAMAEKRGMSEITNAGAELINNSYLLFFNFFNVMSMDEYYDAQAEAGVKMDRTKNGYIGHVDAVLLKVKYDDEIVAHFEDCIGEDGKLDRAEFRKRIMEHPEHIHFITKVVAEADGSQDNELPEGVKKKTRDELFDQLVTQGVDNVLFAICRAYEPFRVKAPLIHKGKQIGAKIGKKEGVKREQRFFVWRYQADANDNGEVVDGYYKRKGVVRAKTVVDNKTCELGKTDTSTFYQVAGGKLRDGYILQERPDFGIGVALGYRLGEIGGIDARVTYGASQLLNQWFDFPITALKIYVDGNLQSKSYEANISGITGEEDFQFITLSIGLVKEFNFLRNYSIGPYIGYGMDLTSLSLTADYSLKTALVNGGLRFTANIVHNIQLMGTLDYYMPMGNAIVEVNGTELVTTAKWTDIFKDREGLSFSFGLRYQF